MMCGYAPTQHRSTGAAHTHTHTESLITSHRISPMWLARPVPLPGQSPSFTPSTTLSALWVSLSLLSTPVAIPELLPWRIQLREGSPLLIRPSASPNHHTHYRDLCFQGVCWVKRWGCWIHLSISLHSSPNFILSVFLSDPAISTSLKVKSHSRYLLLPDLLPCRNKNQVQWVSSLKTCHSWALLASFHHASSHSLLTGLLAFECLQENPSKLQIGSWASPHWKPLLIGMGHEWILLLFWKARPWVTRPSCCLQPLLPPFWHLQVEGILARSVEGLKRPWASEIISKMLCNSVF